MRVFSLRGAKGAAGAQGGVIVAPAHFLAVAHSSASALVQNDFLTASHG